VANEQECTSFLALSRYDPEQMAAQIIAMESRYVDGILLVPTGQPGEKKILAPLLKETAFVPLVQPLAGDSLRTCVHVDDEYGLWLGTNHLISLGHRRIALIGGLGETDACNRRRNGWVRALTEHGIHPSKRLLQGDHFGRECGYDSMLKLLKTSPPPTALIAVSDYAALGAMEAILEVGLRPGEDIAVVGFDNICCAHYSPVPLTTISQPKEELGEAAARALVERIAGRRPRLPTLLPQLVIRRSCGAYKVSSEEAARNN
jgi:LacI family transcriptional regulator